MENNTLIEILLPVYNGRDYLDEQLNSLLNQTYKNIHLLIRDDVSTDDSKNIISRYQQKFPDIITIIDADKNLGSSLSFHELLKYSTADYVMFCDQDDVWLPTKIEDSLVAITNSTFFEKEIRCVYSDLTIVDEQLNIIHPSMRQALKINIDKNIGYKDYLCQSRVTGCTIILNRPAVNCLLKYPPPTRRIIHDHWYTVILSIYGQIQFLDKQTILYRQHFSNQVGVRAVTIRYFGRKLKSLIATYRYDMSINNNIPYRYRINTIQWCIYKIKLNISRFR